MEKLPTVCCVIVLNSENHSEILLTKRAREPNSGKWALISGVGYAEEGKTVEEGVTFEVFGDVNTLPFNIKKQLTITEGSQKVMVFSAEVKKNEVRPMEPHVPEITWCLLTDNLGTKNLAFDHFNIINSYRETSGGSVNVKT